MVTVAYTQRPPGEPGRHSTASLLRWYDRERRDLPWRIRPGKTPDPYRVWLSEIMLQQTTVKAVIPYYMKFLERWPTIEALAGASLDDVLASWAGLGYYSRARNLHKCAKLIAAGPAGKFPSTEAELRELPGIGAYTAAAIAALAFGQCATPVDGNIERVMARLFAVREPLPSAKPMLKAHAQMLTPSKRAGDFAQALMDLGATICTPKRPSCLICPLRNVCLARAQGTETQLPIRLGKPERPLRIGLAFLALREDGCVLLRRRPDVGLLGGMLEVPSTDWCDAPMPLEEALRTAPLRGKWQRVPGIVAHTFTHFRLEMEVYRASAPTDVSLKSWIEAPRCRWVARRDLHRVALPSIMRKIIAHGLAHH
jgi:A/G-specific adenine glycosylase